MHTKHDVTGTRRLITLVATAVALCSALLAIPTNGTAKSPNAGGSQLTITSAAPTIVFGKSVAISGLLKGAGNAGQTILLQQNPFPHAGFTDLATATTNISGNYTFTVAPTTNTIYRVTATTASPVQTSGELKQLVSTKSSIKASDSTPKRGTRVRFTGFVYPAHDGVVAYLQRMSSTGTFSAVASFKLLDSGDARSKYSRSIRVSKSGVYRVQVSADADHAVGYSSTRIIKTH